MSVARSVDDGTHRTDNLRASGPARGEGTHSHNTQQFRLGELHPTVPPPAAREREEGRLRLAKRLGRVSRRVGEGGW